MKAGIVLVLLVFMAMTMDMANARTPLKTSSKKPGACPKPRSGTFGVCAELCSGDDSCPGNQKCCSNGCGHACQTPVFKRGESGSQGRYEK